MKLIVWTAEPVTQTLRGLVPSAEVTVATSALQFLNARRDAETISFLDKSTIVELADQSPPTGPVIAVCDDSLQTAISWLPQHPWLSHVLSHAAINHPQAGDHLAHVLRTLIDTNTPRLLDWVESSVVGRRVRLAQASKRTERLERLTEFYESKGVSSRTIQVLRDAAEELLTNAFYDAPVAAGVLNQAIPRTRDVCLPEESACDMVYGCRDDLAIVRVRDPFGSLSRSRLVSVLTRCARTDMQVEVDESMGGAGLGLWRIFSGASFVSISVYANRHTEILVGMWKRAAGARPFSFHLFFKEPRRKVRTWSLDADTGQAITITTAVTSAESLE